MTLLSRTFPIALLLFSQGWSSPPPSSTNWIVSTFAGSGLPGFLDGDASTARFRDPNGVAVDIAGNVYVADTGNHRIRMISRNGRVTTVAGSGNPAFMEGKGIEASFDSPVSVAVDERGRIYVADRGNRRVRKISRRGVVSTLAGCETGGEWEGIGTNVGFTGPYSIGTDRKDRVYVKDAWAEKYRKISPEGLVSVLDGTEPACFRVEWNVHDWHQPSPDLTKTNSLGHLFIAETWNHRIAEVDTDGIRAVIAGADESGFADGVGTRARFNSPGDIAIDDEGCIYVADSLNHRIRKLTPVRKESKDFRRIPSFIRTAFARLLFSWYGIVPGK